jgi:hypothetical protein
MKQEFEIELHLEQDGRHQLRIINRKKALKQMGIFALATAWLGIFPESTFANNALKASGKKRVSVAGMGQRDLMDKFKKDATCLKIHDQMKNRGLTFAEGKGGTLTASWSGKKAAIMAFTYESSDSYGFLMWSRKGRRIKGCYVINRRDGEAEEAGVADSLEAQEPVIQEVENPEQIGLQMKRSLEESELSTTSFECNVCQLAVELVIGFGCGAGAALIASAACGPGALACAFIVAAVQAAICELLFYPVSREAVCAGLGYC